MVNRWRFLKLFLAAAAAWPIVGWCDEFILQKIPAEQIQKGCDLDFYAVPDGSPSIGRPGHSIDLRWACVDQPPRVIDNYEIEGGSPDIVTVFYRKRQDVIVLVRWSTNSQAADPPRRLLQDLYIQAHAQKSRQAIFASAQRYEQAWGRVGRHDRRKARALSI